MTVPKKIDSMAPRSGRIRKEDDTLINEADILEALIEVVGERVTTPAANTLGARLKTIATALAGILTVTGNVETGALASLKSTATGGSEIEVIDGTKDFETDLFANRIVKVTMDGIDYLRKITSCAGDTLTITPIKLAVAASVVIGEDPGGIVTIRVKAPGTGGNTYSVQLIAGTGEGSLLNAYLDGTVLTITSPTNESEEPTAIPAGNIEGLIAGIPELDDLFSVDQDFTAGDLSLTLEPVQFAGGEDEIAVVADAPYEILA